MQKQLDLSSDEFFKAIVNRMDIPPPLNLLAHAARISDGKPYRAARNPETGELLIFKGGQWVAPTDDDLSVDWARPCAA